MASLPSPTATERVMLSSSALSPVISPASRNQALFSPLSCTRQPASPTSLSCTSLETCAAKEFSTVPSATLSGSSPLAESPSSAGLVSVDDDAAGVLEATVALVASLDSAAACVESASTSAAPQCPREQGLLFSATATQVEEPSACNSTRDLRNGPGLERNASLVSNSNMEGSEVGETPHSGHDAMQLRREAEQQDKPIQTKEETTIRSSSRERERTLIPSRDSQRSFVSLLPSHHSSSPGRGNPGTSEMDRLQDTPPSLPTSASGPEAPSATGTDGETERFEQQTAGTGVASGGAKSNAEEPVVEATKASKDDRPRSSVMSSASSSSLGSSAGFVRVSSSSSSSLGRKGDEGSLLRLFQSEYFDAYFHMYYLFHRQEAGVHEYLVNLLYMKRTDEDIIFYLPQLVQLSLVRFKTSSLHRFLLDKASKSMHLALMASWLYQSMVEDKVAGLEEPAQKMTQEVEMAVVNCKPLGAGTQQSGWCRKEEVEDQGHSDRGQARRRNNENAPAVDLFKRRRIVQLIRQHQHALHESYSANTSDFSASSLPFRTGAVSAAPGEAQQVATASSRVEGSVSSDLSSQQSYSSEACKCVRAASPRGEREHSPSPAADSEIASPRPPQPSGLMSSLVSPGASQRTAISCVSVSAKRGGLRRPTLSVGALLPRIPQNLRHLTGPMTVAGAKVKLPSVYGKLGNPLSLSTLQLPLFSSSGAASRREVREKAPSGWNDDGTTEGEVDRGERNRGDTPAEREETRRNGGNGGEGRVTREELLLRY